MDNRTRIINHLKDNNYTIKLALGDFKFKPKKIGEGPNGLVYEAYTNNRFVAIKFLIADDTGNSKEERNKMFLLEYFKIITLDDANTFVHYIDYDKYLFEDSDGVLELPLIIMSKYKSSLAGLKKCGSEKEFISLYEFLIQAVGFAHNYGIFHGDLKPENILVKNNKFYLADFGMPVFNPELFETLVQTKKDQRLGNRLFSAPEQEVKGVQPHETMDIYAIGQILQWYVTGKTHRGKSRQKITTIFPGLSHYDEIIERCLQVDKNYRFQSIIQINEWLQKVSRKPTKDIENFNNILRESFPKIKSGFTYSKKLEDIVSFLTILTKNLESFENKLEWVGNPGNDKLEVLKQIYERIWRFDSNEFDITDMWIHYSNIDRRNFVLFRYRKGVPFIIGSEKTYITHMYKDKHHIPDWVVNNEKETEIDGQIIKLNDIKIERIDRQREMGFFFMATSDNCVICHKNQNAMTDFFDELIDRKKKPSFKELTIFERELVCFSD